MSFGESSARAVPRNLKGCHGIRGTADKKRRESRAPAPAQFFLATPRKRQFRLGGVTCFCASSHFAKHWSLWVLNSRGFASDVLCLVLASVVARVEIESTVVVARTCSGEILLDECFSVQLVTRRNISFGTVSTIILWKLEDEQILQIFIFFTWRRDMRKRWRRLT